jgi:hypothetical protein
LLGWLGAAWKVFRDDWESEYTEGRLRSDSDTSSRMLLLLLLSSYVRLSGNSEALRLSSVPDAL